MKKRIIGALFIILLGIPILWLGGNVFRFTCGILGCLALKELVDLKEHHKKIPDIIFLLGVVILMLLLLSGMNSNFLYLELNFKIVSLAFLLLFLPTLFYKNNQYNTHEAIYLFGGILFLALFLNSIIFIRIYNVWILVYLIFIAIFTDTFAYIVGSKIGKHKCSSLISPNKTWEGCIAGTVLGSFIASLFYIYQIGELSIIKIILLSVFLSIIGQLGDLLFSKIKRENNIKDFSHFIPGHGGILDRFDSLIFIVISYTLLIGLI